MTALFNLSTKEQKLREIDRRLQVLMKPLNQGNQFLERFRNFSKQGQEIKRQ